MKNIYFWPVALVVLGSAASGPALGQSYALEWSRVSGGGSSGIGGPYALSVTIGQAEAGAGVGGPYALSQGYWSVTTSAQQPTPVPIPTTTPLPSPTVTPTSRPSATPTPTPTGQAPQLRGPSGNAELLLLALSPAAVLTRLSSRKRGAPRS
jgi:hypothetical protein